jgi:uncharacterized protein involved in exopolysaccharide biosynthesis
VASIASIGGKLERRGETALPESGMTQPPSGPAGVLQRGDEPSLLSMGSVFLRYRRMIVALGVIGAAAGLAAGLLSTRKYQSSAIFIPQGSQEGTSALALAAGQFGIRVPTSGSAWGPAVYVELLRSRAFLESIALDSVVVVEQGGRRVGLIDLLKIKAPTPARRLHLAVDAIRRIVNASEDRRLSAVRLSVTTEWPSVSLALAQLLVRGVNRFNVETRRSQATAERQFVEVQASEAERALRESEDRLQSFLQRNRAITGSPELEFERDRLQRDVELRQRVYTTLVQNRDEARIREVRDTPVITVLEDPRLPAVGESRGSANKAILGGLVGGVFGVLIALLAEGVTGLRTAASDDAREFFRLLEDAMPQFLRRRAL